MTNDHDYDRWSDAELLEEADDRGLNSSEASMLDSMMHQSGFRRATAGTSSGPYSTSKPLTGKQRAWLVNLLETTSQAEDD